MQFEELTKRVAEIYESGIPEKFDWESKPYHWKHKWNLIALTIREDVLSNIKTIEQVAEILYINFWRSGFSHSWEKLTPLNRKKYIGLVHSITKSPMQSSKFGFYGDTNGLRKLLEPIADEEKCEVMTHKKVRATARLCLQAMEYIHFSLDVTSEINLLLYCISSVGLPHYDRAFAASEILRLLDEIEAYELAERNRNTNNSMVPENF